MRPRKLTIEGLRSYRSRQVIDFEDASLLAVLGDTGAGKSSLLEAICVALYAGSTWDQRNVKALISSGVDVLQVELDFTAGGKDWRVFRSLSADGYPQSVHRLEGLSDGTRYDAAREVNRRIEEIVGLDHSAFLRAVMLPQGRFQALLQARDADRTRTLKSLFGLDALERIRERAGTKLEELEPRLVEIEARRARLESDPEAVAAVAEARRASAAAECERLEAALGLVRAAGEGADKVQRDLDRLDEASRRTAEQDPAEPLERLEELCGIEEGLAEERQRLERERDEALRRRSELETLARQAEAAGLGRDAVLHARRTLADALEALASAATTAQRLDAEARAHEEKARELLARREKLRGHDEALGRARQALESARARRDATRSALAEAERVLASATQRRRDLDGKVESLAASDREAQSLERELSNAREGRISAERNLERSDAALEALRRAGAAVHAAHGAKPGDPCPVCERALPKGWSPPAAPDLERAEAAAAEARSAAVEAARALAALEARLESLEERRRRDAAEREHVERELQALRGRLAELAGAPAEPGAPLDRRALAPLERAVAESGATLQAAERAHESELREREEVARRVAALEAETSGEAKRLDGDRARLDREAAERARRIAALPESLRADSRDESALRASVARADEALERAGRSAEELGRAHSLLEKLHAEERAAAERRRTALDEPRQEATRDFDVLRHHLEELARELGAEPPPRSDSRVATELAAWARELATSRHALLERVAARRRDLSSELSSARAERERILRESGAGDGRELERRRDNARVQALVAADERDRARAQIEPARELDRRIEVGRPFLDALRDLRALLSDGKFVGHVVQLEQTALLAVASRLLGEMTNDGYGFASDFRVVDRVSGSPRDVQTLSGGETFLASLALALGLVELAGRAGGRLEALFLDEGFGSLDANALGEALEALEQQAAKGRLVVVISHLRAVAESIERVLFVTRTPSGSRAEWLSDEERVVLVEAEARGLVS